MKRKNKNLLLLPILAMIACCLMVSPSLYATVDSNSTDSTVEEKAQNDKKAGEGLLKKVLKLFKAGKKDAAAAKGDVAKAKKFKSSHVHLKHMVKYSKSGLSKASHYDSLYPPSGVRFNLPVDSLNQIVMGFHPYWQGTKYRNYNYQLLSDIAYFSYEVDPSSGSYKSVHDWRTTAMIDSAQAHGTKVYLTATLFGGGDNSRFLGNEKAVETFVDSVIALIQFRKANGLMLDFENVRASDKQKYADFIIQVAGKLHGLGLKLGMTIPVYDTEKALTIEVINAQVDMVVMMAYGFHGSKSDYAGPVSTLKNSAVWGKYDIDDAVDTYLKDQLQLNKLVIAFPYYGSQWQTEQLTVPSKSKLFKENLTYATIRKTIEEPSELDTSSASAWIPYTSSKGDFLQVWYDDSLSLSLKYDWALQKKVAGVGIWALGYDDGYTSLWALLAQKFTGNPVIPESNAADTNSTANAVTSDASKAGNAFVQLVFNHPPLLITILTFFLVAALLAFVLALTSCKTREILFESRVFRLVFSAFFTVCLLALFRILGFFEGNEIYSWIFFGLGFLAANSIQFFHFFRPPERP